MSEEMGLIQKITGIFTAPRQAFESIDQKPTWLVPFIIMIVFFLIMQLLTIDIQMADRLKIMEAKDVPQEQLDMMRTQLQGPAKYIGIVVGPIMILLFWAIFAGIFYMAGNLTIGGDSSFKKVFAVISWSSLIGSVSLLLMTFLMLSKDTSLGIAMDLTVLLDTPPLGTEKSTLYNILAKFDLFTIWGIFLWIIGLSVTYKSTVKKAAIPIVGLWILWIIISVSFAGVFENLGM